jgi:putative transposase
MFTHLTGFFLFLSSFFRSRCNLGLEIMALRQQLGVLNRKHPRPRLRTGDKLFWVLLQRFWSGWRNAIIVVKPDPVVGWHRAGFRLFWRFRSRTKKPDRMKPDKIINAVTVAAILFLQDLLESVLECDLTSASSK